MISSAHAIDIIFQHFQGVRNWKRANEEDEKIEMEYICGECGEKVVLSAIKYGFGLPIFLLFDQANLLWPFDFGTWRLVV